MRFIATLSVILLSTISFAAPTNNHPNAGSSLPQEQDAALGRIHAQDNSGDNGVHHPPPLHPGQQQAAQQQQQAAQQQHQGQVNYGPPPPLYPGQQQTAQQQQQAAQQQHQGQVNYDPPPPYSPSTEVEVHSDHDPVPPYSSPTPGANMNWEPYRATGGHNN